MHILKIILLLQLLYLPINPFLLEKQLNIKLYFPSTNITFYFPLVAQVGNSKIILNDRIDQHILDYL